MGLIIKDKIPMFMKGYPTVSDKYNVAGGTLDQASAPVEFGDLLVYGTTKGYFAKPTTITNVSEIAGFILATNVKLTTEWPGETVKTLPGEAFNLLINGFLAIALDESAVEANVKPNAAVYATPAGKCTTEAGASNANFKLPNVVFTGMVEAHGDVLFAEIYVK